MPRKAEGSLAWLRARNRDRLVEELRSRGPLSQADLARLTGLSRTTVSNVVAELRASGLLRELEAGPPGARGGRAAVGIDFGHSHVRVAAADPAAHILAERQAELDVDHDAAAALDRAAKLF